jgi:4'-phosphopantetheinyl transferase
MDRLIVNDVAHGVAEAATPAARGWNGAVPCPGAGTAVWRIDLALRTALPPEQSAWLSQEEHDRADRFLRAEDRARFVESHAALRLILAGYGDRRPQDLIFAQEPGGRPVLASHPRAGLHFNLSHSGSLALVGISTATPIGVDVEAIRPVGDPLTIARAHFHRNEIAALTQVPQSRQGPTFFRLWTRKEAVVKALGTGLMGALDGFDVSAGDPSGPAIAWEDMDPVGSGWSLSDVDLGPEAAGAVAIPLPDQSCHRYHLPKDWAARA